MRFGQGTTKNGEVLCKYKDPPAIDQSVPGHDPVPRENLPLHSKISRTMCNKLVEFLEGAIIQQKVDSFARRQFTGSVLFGRSFWATACFRSFDLQCKFLYP